MTIESVAYIGGLCQFVFQTIGWLFRRMPRSEQLWPTFCEVGIRSLPVVAITGTFIGMVLAVQTYYQFRTLGLESRLGAVINMTLVRELGPVLAATMLAGRVGSSMAAFPPCFERFCNCTRDAWVRVLIFEVSLDLSQGFAEDFICFIVFSESGSPSKPLNLL